MPKAQPSLLTPQLLIEIGQSLYGVNGWQNELANNTDVTKSMISLMARGLRTIPPRFVAQLATLAADHAAELSDIARQLNLILDTEGKK